MAIERPKDLVPKFFGDTAGTYDRVATWATLGKDSYWKNEILKLVPPINSCLDLACGTGILTRKIAKKYPDAKVTGIDISESYLEVAKRNSRNSNILFVKGDAEMISLGKKFDCIVSSYIPKYCDPQTLADVITRHLNPGGRVVLHDFLYPQSKAMQNLWNAYFGFLGFVGFFAPSWKYAFQKLPVLIESSRWLEDYDLALKKFGFATSRKLLTWKTSAILVGINLDFQENK